MTEGHVKCREINKAGLPGLYSTILATAGPELCKALEVRDVAAAHRQQLKSPAVIHTLPFCAIAGVSSMS